ncbi:MAG: hypothetical protein EBR82_18505 [Caulobacteraceae bacterium]|nr:hypothetical protein [Caulobacteraceae bacterium]
MSWLEGVAYVFGGMFLANALPHLVAALMGRPFQTPFARPPGQGLSSSLVNGLWGFANLVIAWLLLCRVGDFDLGAPEEAAAFGAGFLLIVVFLSRRFGRFNGGNTPEGE